VNEDQSSEGRVHCTIYQLVEEANNMNKFMIIVDHDRINNVLMIKSQEEEKKICRRSKVKAQKEECIAEVSSRSMEILRSQLMHRKR
jgi:hypothetical protein